MCSRATEGEMKLDTYVGKRYSLFRHHYDSYTDLGDKLYYVSGLYLAFL